MVPGTKRLIDAFRSRGIDGLFARLACQPHDGRGRSQNQKKPGWNNLPLPKNEAASQIVSGLALLTGTNLRIFCCAAGSDAWHRG